jgi:cytochrome b6-f complex iron-sulfur subunit
MSGTAILIVVALGVLALVTLVATQRRSDTRRALSRESVKKDRGESPFLASQAPPTARDVERQAQLARTGGPGKALEPVKDTAPVPYVPVDPEVVGVSRRQFFNRGIVAMFVLGLSGFGASVLAFLWPRLGGGFGSKINAGKLDDILQQVQENRQPFYSAEGRFYVSPYPEESLAKAKAAYKGPDLAGMEGGVVALYQKCVHLGCRVPWCATSQWFECGCHGSQYNRVGEKKGGPAPRGLDRFPVELSGGNVVVDTGTVLLGPAIGVNTTGQEAEGPHCISAAGGH